MIVGSPTKLNLIPSGVMPVVYINQGDAGYDKEFLVYNGDSPYNVPAGVSATIRGKKADGYGVTEAAALTEGSNLVTVTITEQMVAAAGANLYELVFVDTDGLRIATINMVWAVKNDALGDAVISDSDLDYAAQVMDQLQSVQAFKNQLDTNTENIETNAADILIEKAARIAADDAEKAARIAADNTLQANISAEALTRTSQDNTLQAQINQIVAPSGGAPSAAEVQNARIGADGVTYSTLGDAIRTQVGNLQKDLNNKAQRLTDVDGIITPTMELGTIAMASTSIAFNPSTTAVRTPQSGGVRVSKGDTLSLTDYTIAKYRYAVLKDVDSRYDVSGWVTADAKIDYDGVVYIVVAYSDDRTVTSVLDLQLLVQVKRNAGSIYEVNTNLNALNTYTNIFENSAFLVSDFGTGTFDRGDGYIPALRPYRVSTTHTLSFAFGLYIQAKTGFQFWIDTYSGGSWTREGWIASGYIPPNTIFGITIAKVTEDSSTTADVTEFVSALIVQNKFLNDYDNETAGLLDEEYVRSRFVMHYTHDGSGNYEPDLRRNAITNPLHYDYDIILSTDSTHSLAYQLFDGYETGSAHFISASGWTKKATIPAGSYFCVIIRNDDNSETTAATNDALNVESVQPINEQVLRVFNITEALSESIAPYTGNYLITSTLKRENVAVSASLGQITCAQAFCIYNEKYYSLNNATIAVQDENFEVLNTKAISAGHGNSLQLGSSNKAYASGWDDNTVYVIDLDLLEIVSTITLPTTGYTTAVVDDVNSIAYIFQRDTFPDTEAVYSFIAYDYANEEVLYTRKTPLLAGMQSCDLYNDSIFVVCGLGTAAAPNHFMVFNTSGGINGEYILPQFSTEEPEGVCFNRSTYELLISMYSRYVYKLT